MQHVLVRALRWGRRGLGCRQIARFTGALRPMAGSAGHPESGAGPPGSGAGAMEAHSVAYVMREKGLIIAGQLLERFAYVGVYALMPVYLMRYPMLLTSDATILVIHAFFFTTFFLALVAETLVAAGMATAAPTVALSALVVCGTAGVLAVSLVAALLAAQRMFVVYASTLFHAGAYASLVLLAAGSGGLRSTLPILGSWHYGTSAREADGAPQAARALDKHRGRFLVLLWHAECAAYALAVIAVPLVASRVHCLGMPNCYPAAYGVAGASALGCLAVVALALCRPRPGGGADRKAGISPGTEAAGSGAASFGGRLPAGDTVVEVPADASSNLSGGPAWLPRRGRWRAARTVLRRLWGATRGFAVYLRARGRRAPRDDGLSPAFAAACECGVRALQTSVPVALFWALYSQQNTVWVFQASRMQCVVRFPFFVRSRLPWLEPLVVRVRPEQTIVARPLCAMAMRPVVVRCVLPWWRAARGGTDAPPAAQMLAGSALAAAAFGASAALQAVVVGAISTPRIISGSGAWGVGTVPVALQLPQYVLMAAGELLLAPAAMAHVLQGRGAGAGAGESRTALAVAFMHAHGCMCAAQVLVALVVALGAGATAVLHPVRVLWTLVAWTVIGCASATVFGLVLWLFRRG